MCLWDEYGERFVSGCASGMSRVSERDGNILCQDVAVGCLVKVMLCACAISMVNVMRQRVPVGW